MAQEQLQDIPFVTGGFKGVNENISSSIADPSFVVEGENVQFGQTAGVAEASKGYLATTDTNLDSLSSSISWSSFLEYPSSMAIANTDGSMYYAQGFTNTDPKSHIYWYDRTVPGWVLQKDIAASSFLVGNFFHFEGYNYYQDGESAYSEEEGTGSWGSTNLTGFAPGLFWESLKGRLVSARYSGNDAFITWSSIVSSSNTITWNLTDFNTRVGDSADYITDICNTNDNLVIVKSKSIWTMQINGDINVSLRPLITNVGGVGDRLHARKKAISYNGLCFVLGHEGSRYGAYVTDGQSVPRKISNEVDSLFNSANANSGQVALGDGVVKFYLGLVTGSSPSRYLEMQFRVDTGTWQYRYLDSPITTYSNTGKASNFNRVIISKKIYDDDTRGSESTPQTFGTSSIASKITTHYKTLFGTPYKGEVREVYITGDKLDLISVQVVGIDNPEDWKDVQNQSAYPNIFCGKVDVKSSRVRLKITSTQPGWKIEEILLRAKGDNPSTILG